MDATNTNGAGTTSSASDTQRLGAQRITQILDRLAAIPGAAAGQPVGDLQASAQAARGIGRNLGSSRRMWSFYGGCSGETNS